MARRTGLMAALVVVGAVVICTIAAIGAAQSGNRFDAQRMSATFEVPAVSRNARGEFEATLDGDTVDYKLTYSGLESDCPVGPYPLRADVCERRHLGVALRTSFNPHPTAELQPVTPDCGGPRSGEINDSFDAAEVIGPAAQGFSAGEFSALLEAMRAGLTYANVHSMAIPGGEIRGQLKPRGGGGDDDDGALSGPGDFATTVAAFCL